MTRINVGIDPHELCDQHLRAEYHELPRLWKFKPKSTPPAKFKLGTGHVLWCSQYPGMLADRHIAIVTEMRARGFTVNYPNPPESALLGRRPLLEEVQVARGLLLERLQERLSTMKRKPQWSRRVTP